MLILLLCTISLAYALHNFNNCFDTPAEKKEAARAKEAQKIRDEQARAARELKKREWEAGRAKREDATRQEAANRLKEELALRASSAGFSWGVCFIIVFMAGALWIKVGLTSKEIKMALDMFFG